MTPIGIKFIVERLDGAVTTWHDIFDRNVEDILSAVIPKKDWQNGKVLEAYVEFRDSNGKYLKVHLDCSRLTKVLASQPPKKND